MMAQAMTTTQPVQNLKLEQGYSLALRHTETHTDGQTDRSLSQGESHVGHEGCRMHQHGNVPHRCGKTEGSLPLNRQRRDTKLLGL